MSVTPEQVPKEVADELCCHIAFLRRDGAKVIIAAALSAWPRGRKAKSVNAVTEDLGNFIILPLGEPAHTGETDERDA